VHSTTLPFLRCKDKGVFILCKEMIEFFFAVGHKTYFFIEKFTDFILLF